MKFKNDLDSKIKRDTVFYIGAVFSVCGSYVDRRIVKCLRHHNNTMPQKTGQERCEKCYYEKCC